MEKDSISTDWKKRDELINKAWDAASPDEKIEKLKIEVMELRNLLFRMSNMESKLSLLSRHSHNYHGDIVIPFDNHGNGIGSITAGSRRDSLK